MHKKAQISVFLLIGIVILVIIGIFLYQRTQVVKAPEMAAPVNVAAVQVYVQQCLEKTASDAVLYIGQHGGYYYMPEEFSVFPDINTLNVETPAPLLNIPFYFYEGKDFVPTKEEMEKQLSYYVSFNLPGCADLGAFAQQGFKVEAGAVNVNSAIGEKNVVFIVDYPVNISRGNEKQTISRFTTVVNADLIKLYDSANLYMQSQRNDPTAFFISSLSRICLDKVITFKSLFYGKHELLITLTDDQTRINNQPLIFAFAIKYRANETIEGLGAP